jgi:hypothetical protein
MRRTSVVGSHVRLDIGQRWIETMAATAWVVSGWRCAGVAARAIRGSWRVARLALGRYDGQPWASARVQHRHALCMRRCRESAQRLRCREERKTQVLRFRMVRAASCESRQLPGRSVEGDRGGQPTIRLRERGTRTGRRKRRSCLTARPTEVTSPAICRAGNLVLLGLNGSDLGGGTRT